MTVETARSAPAPRSERDLLTAAAVDLARWLRERRVSSVELVETTIRRIERVNPALNAVVHTRFERARHEAALADERLARGSDPAPLLGVPCTIKEFFAVEGAPQTGGLVARKGTISSSDAPTVARLRAAGAIVVGTTNVPEGGIWLETFNSVYGRTNNPWDLARTSGGSSGGEGAIIAAGGSPFGLGSDIGGSVRIPAAFCGIVGHKPSGRLLPNGGQFPAPTGEALALLCPGPMVRRVRDVMPLLRVLAGPDPSDPVCVQMELGDPATVDVRDLTVYVAPHNARFRARGVMMQAVEDAARALERRGARVVPFDVTKLRRGLEYWAGALAESAEESYDELLASGTGRARIGVPLELLKAAAGRSNHTLPALVVAAAGSIVQRFGGATSGFARAAAELRAELAALLGDRGVLLHPPYTRPAPRHHAVWATPFDPAYTAIFNVMETPVTAVPIGFDPRGLPVGVQVIAAPGRDHVAVSAAQALEDHFGGWMLATPLGSGS
ncbi:MAG: amidase [Polyangiaceae bacterium]|jgi:fatty acid amide hydrolase 2|nr:amidase [Polyangiaceae bacterium]MBK8941949.1 amidase [Polyangiaceae bacterium]